MVSDFLIFIKNNKNLLLEIIGPFLGAFFAFCFFILGNKIQSKIDWNKKVKKEHAFLERYLVSVYQIVSLNKKMLEKSIDSYNSNCIDIFSFILIPIKDDITMNIKDKIFINRLEIYIAEIRELNFNLKSLSDFKNKIDNNLLGKTEEDIKRGEIMIKNFLEQAEIYKKTLEYHLYKADKIISENRILLKKYKNWSYKKNKIEKDSKRRKESVEKDIEERTKEKDNPIYNEYLDDLAKFGLYNKNNEE